MISEEKLLELRQATARITNESKAFVNSLSAQQSKGEASESYWFEFNNDEDKFSSVTVLSQTMLIEQKIVITDDETVSMQYSVYSQANERIAQKPESVCHFWLSQDGFVRLYSANMDTYVISQPTRSMARNIACYVAESMVQNQMSPAPSVHQRGERLVLPDMSLNH